MGMSRLRSIMWRLRLLCRSLYEFELLRSADGQLLHEVAIVFAHRSEDVEDLGGFEG